MRYFLTDQQNTSWRNIKWGEGVTHEEHNSNYFFETYSDPLVAAFLYPCYMNEENPKLWECSAEDVEGIDYGTVSRDDGIRRKFPRLTTLKEIPLAQPTDDQRISLAMLCAMNLSGNPLYLAWVRNWMLGLNRSVEMAQSVSDGLIDEMWMEYRHPRQYYLGNAFATVHAVIENPTRYAANGIYRAWIDSVWDNEHELPELDLPKLANIALRLSPEDIGREFWK